MYKYIAAFGVPFPIITEYLLNTLNKRAYFIINNEMYAISMYSKIVISCNYVNKASTTGEIFNNPPSSATAYHVCTNITPNRLKI